MIPTSTHDLAAVSGATGFIGSAVVRKLLAEGRKSIRYMQRLAYFDGEKTWRELGMPSRNSIERAVEFFQTNGMV